MRKAPFHLLGRKNQSLFDTSVRMQDMGSENMEFMMDSPAIPESGTASVRARPTVNHHSSSYETFQGIAVQTPKVPVLPSKSGVRINGSVGGDQSSNGSVISLEEGEIFVPPPPSVAPPPPPGTFILPPPDVYGDLNSPELANLQLPSIPAPRPPSVEPHMMVKDVSIPKPPAMAPPNIPSNGLPSPSPVYSLPTAKHSPVPSQSTLESPKCSKTPPQKPTRFSSVSTLDSPPHSPAPPPPAHMPTLSTFNPKNTAKLYDVPKTSFYSSQEENDRKPKQRLLMEDSGYYNSLPAQVQSTGKETKVALPSPPSFGAVQGNLQSTKPVKIPPATAKKPVGLPLLNAQQFLKGKSLPLKLDPKANEADTASGHTYSPLLDSKLRDLKNNEGNASKDGHSASPLALLMAAKKRDKHRCVTSMPHEDKRNDPLRASIDNLSPNSFHVTPKSESSSPLLLPEVRLQESPTFSYSKQHTQNIDQPGKTTSPVQVGTRTPSTVLDVNRGFAAKSPNDNNVLGQPQYAAQSPSKPPPPHQEDHKELFDIPLLPPPPEFDDIDDFIEPPPTIRPPDPPTKKPPRPILSSIPPALVPPPPPKPTPPPPPKLPPPNFDIKPKPNVQATPKLAPTNLPSNLSPSQVTLLSILQKKMLEMDQKMPQPKEADSAFDDWTTNFPEEENVIPVITRSKPLPPKAPAVNKAVTLDMQELENRMTRKPQHPAPLKSPPASNGPQQQSKHQYGMTFTVRPGTKNPITVVRREDP